MNNLGGFVERRRDQEKGGWVLAVEDLKLHQFGSGERRNIYTQQGRNMTQHESKMKISF